MSDDAGNTTPKSKPGAHLAAHHWEKGKSGNPSGRPAGTKGLAARIRERTKDGEVILDILFDTLTGSKSTPRDRLDASKMLLERGWGKAPEITLNVNANSSHAEIVAELADAHLESLARALLTPASVTHPVIEIPPSPALPPSPELEQASSQGDGRLEPDATIVPEEDGG